MNGIPNAWRHERWEQHVLMAKNLPNSKFVRHLRRRAAASVASVFVAGLGGCAVGPDFISPPPPDVNRYTPEKLSSIDGRGLVVSEEIPRRWWEVFHNKNLNRLIEASIEHNPTLQAADASIRTAYFAAEAQKGGFLPTALLNGSDTTNLQSGVEKRRDAQRSDQSLRIVSAAVERLIHARHLGAEPPRRRIARSADGPAEISARGRLSRARPATSPPRRFKRPRCAARSPPRAK